jgi:hypothetical protein
MYVLHAIKLSFKGNEASKMIRTVNRLDEQTLVRVCFTRSNRPVLSDGERFGDWKGKDIEFRTSSAV